MLKNFDIRSPFFEFGTKAYLYGKDAINMALYADELVRLYDIDIIFTPQYTDIYPIAQKTNSIKVFAPHMDSISIGRGFGSVLPEALKASGAVGVLLNHIEKPLTLYQLDKAIKRADDMGFATIACASDSPESAAAVACLNPNIIVAESAALIDGGKRNNNDNLEIEIINTAVKNINSDIFVLHGAGITDENDVYKIILAGADASGCTSAVLKAADPEKMLKQMIEAVAQAYKDRINKN